MSALEENRNLFKQWAKEFSCALAIKEVYENDSDNSNGFYNFMVEFKNWLYNSIHNFLTPNKYSFDFEKTIRVYCDFINEKILPICYEKIKFYKKNKSEDNHLYLNKWLDLEDDFMALACYRNLRLTALYLERGKSEKLWNATMPLFESFFDYSQKMVFGEKIKLIRASYFPGAGKTYAANILCAFWFGYDSEMSILRITYSDDLCKIFIQQIASIIDSKQFRKIFPAFNKGEGIGNKDLYLSYSVEVGFQFNFSTVKNFYASTRDGQTTGKRGKVLIIDDLTKGSDEAFDERLHKRMVNKYDTEWTSRADKSYQPVIALGTMWSNLDLLNVLKNRAFKRSNCNIIPHKKYKYAEIAVNENGEVDSVFIATPILDYETDKTTCPERYDTKEMREKRENMDEALWNAVYQQRPTPPKEFLFAYSKLLTYTDDTIPKELFAETGTQTYAFIDPTRKGTDFFAMGIFKRYKESTGGWSKWYLIDCIFEQKPPKELIYDVAFKIVHHKITRLGYENNIDVSFDDLLNYKLKEIGGKGIEIDSFFSSNESKQTKISNASFGMRKEIIYPSIKMYALNSPMGKGMQQFTSWSLSQKYGDHDDFPDMISMFVKYYCEQMPLNTMTVLDALNFRI